MKLRIIKKLLFKLLYIGDIIKRLAKKFSKTVQDTGLSTTVCGVFKEEN